MSLYSPGLCGKAGVEEGRGGAKGEQRGGGGQRRVPYDIVLEMDEVRGGGS